MHDFRRLRVWQLAREFAVAIDGVSRRFPRTGRGVLANQVCRAAISIPSNIAEGCGRSSRRETIRFFQIASGSTREVESHLLLAMDLRYLDSRECDRLLATATTIERMLFKLMQTLADSPAS